MVALLRYYREEARWPEWERTKNKIEISASDLSSDLKASYYYEIALSKLFRFDVNGLKKALADWPTFDELPMWEARKAGLLAEAGDLERAVSTIESALRRVRERLNLQPIAQDYTELSYEAYILMHVQYIRNSVMIGRSQNPFSDEVRERVAKESSQVSERLKFHRSYGLDPWGELRWFETRLKPDPKPWSSVTWKQEFDIGQASRVVHLGYDNTEMLNAYQFLRFFEVLGMSFRLPGTHIAKDSASGAVARLANASDYWATTTLLRLGTAENADRLFGRQRLSQFASSDADALIEEFCSLLDRWAPTGNSKSESIYTSDLNTVLNSPLPEVLSRLVTRASRLGRTRALITLRLLYESEPPFELRSISNLVNRLLESMGFDELFENLSAILEFKPSQGQDLRRKSNYINPVEVLLSKGSARAGLRKPHIEEATLEKNLRYLGSGNLDERRWGIINLFYLFDQLLLSPEKQGQFSVALWSSSLNGWPTETDFLLRHAILRLEPPSGIDPTISYKGYVLGLQFPVQTKAATGIALHGGESPLCEELIGSRGSVIWSDEEFDSVFAKLLNWWDTDKFVLDKSRDDTLEEMSARLKNAARLVSDFVLPFLANKGSTKWNEPVDRIVSEMVQRRLNPIRLLLATGNFFGRDWTKCQSLFASQLLSSSTSAVLDCVVGLIRTFEKNTEQPEIKRRTSLLSFTIAVATSGRESNLYLILDGLRQCIGVALDLVSPFDLHLLQTRLDLLVEETDLKNDGSQIELSQRLAIRRAAMGLASDMYEHSTKRGIEIPNSLERWKRLAAEDGEFNEIRKLWTAIGK
jgi:hypothetical protein